MQNKNREEVSPIVTLGKYKGRRIDQLPNSYLRWLVTKPFPKPWLEAAKKKLGASKFDDIEMNVSRHALDMFSTRFLSLWMDAPKEEHDAGIATYVARLAQEAWDKGEDISKHRHQDEGITREYRGVKWVFGVSPSMPEYKDVITIMD